MIIYDNEYERASIVFEKGREFPATIIHEAKYNNRVQAHTKTIIELSSAESISIADFILKNIPKE